MSAYAEQMERAFSARSLPSQGNSEIASSIGSTESGFYMTSFSATVFIASLVTVGVLLITLLVALTVMLQSCESKNAGIVEMEKLNSGDREVCRIYDLHTELNGIDEMECRSTCCDLAGSYISGGQYERELKISIGLAEDYFSEIRPLADGLDLVLIDIDSILSSYTNQRSEQDVLVDNANRLRNLSLLKLYRKLQETGWSLGLLTRNIERERNFITDHIVSTGFGNWSALIMRYENEKHLDSQEYLYKRRVLLRNAGFRIRGTISSHMDALANHGPGERVFKLPNPIHRNLPYPLDKAGAE